MIGESQRFASLIEEAALGLEKRGALSSIEDLPSVWSMESGSQAWIVDGLIPAQAITLLTGAAGIGKSMLALALSGSVAWGKSFLGRRCEQMPVLILDRENPLSVVHDRLEDLHIGQHRDIRYWGMWHEAQYGQPPDPNAEIIRRFVVSGKPLVVMDSLIAFLHGSEQDATETRKFMQILRRLAAAGATVVVLHHTGKGDTSKDYRGSSDIPAAVDAAFVLERTGGGTGLEKLTLRNFKMRCAEAPGRLGLEFREGHFAAVTDPFVQETLKAQDDLRRIVEATPGISKTAAEGKLTEFGVKRARARELVTALITSGEIVPTKEGKGGGQTLRLAEMLELQL